MCWKPLIRNLRFSLKPEPWSALFPLALFLLPPEAVVILTRMFYMILQIVAGWFVLPETMRMAMEECLLVSHKPIIPPEAGMFIRLTVSAMPMIFLTILYWAITLTGW